MKSRFFLRVVARIREIPAGKVATYGQLALYAGNHRASRQVARILHSSSEKERLPWHRVINRKGCISLKPGSGFERQKTLLECEGVVVSGEGCVNLSEYLWKPPMRINTGDD